MQGRVRLESDVAVERPFYRCIVSGEDTRIGERAVGMSISDTVMIRSDFLEITENSTGSVDIRNGIALEKEEEFCQKILRYNSQSTWPLFLEMVT